MKRFLNISTILGVLLLVAAGFIIRHEASQSNKYELATGTVTKVTITSINSGGDFYYFCPTIEFMTFDERDIMYYPACTNGPDYKKGQQVEIYYDSINPADSHIKGVEVKREWFEPEYSKLLIGLGLLIFVAGIFQGWQLKRSELHS